MIQPPRVDADGASTIGNRTLEAFAATPRLNAWLFSKLAPNIQGDVLEIGSGIGTLSRLIAPLAASVVLSDVASDHLERLRQSFDGDPRVSAVAYDLEAEAPGAIAERRYDTVVAVNVLEHIRDDRALVGRLAALLRPGGKLVVYVPACPFAYGSLDRALGHYRRYTPKTLAALLESAGLVTPRPAYMNLVGLVGWTFNGRVLQREQLSHRQIAVFERLMWLVRGEDWLRLPIGLGVYAAAQKLTS